MLAFILGLGLLIGSWSQNQTKASLAASSVGSVLGKANPVSGNTLPLPSFPPISPVAMVSQKWNWPINVYNPEAFKRFWQYNDNPVQGRQVIRSWAYGSAPLARFLEQYKDSPQGLRLVEYWDKTRLEITDPSKPSEAPDYVTRGLLVKELMTGEAQIGEKSYMTLGPSTIPVVNDVQGSTLTYALLAQVASLKNNNRVEKQLESTVTATLDKEGRTVKDPNLAHYQVKYSYYSAELGHNIPNVFWDFLNSNGTVFLDGKFQTARLYDWQAIAGLPLTEAYWTRAFVNGKSQDVLVQAFERRTLLYTPTNGPGFQVEWGNVGQHYFQWRYPDTDFSNLKPSSTVPSVMSVQPSSPIPSTTVSAGLADTLEIRLVLANAEIARTLNIQNGRVTRSGLVNRQTGQTYADTEGMGAGGGFLLKLDGPDGATDVINGDQFTITGYSMPVTSENERQLVLNGSVLFRGQSLNAKFYWRTITGRNYIEKWVTLEPNAMLTGWRIRFATIEDLPLVEGLKAAPPTPDEASLPILIPTQRNSNVAGGAIFTHVMVADNQSEGFYFFSATPLGGEYALNKRVVMFQEEYQDLKDGFISGKAILGSYTGAVDVGFKRYTDYLQNHYSQMAGKRQPVWYHSWYPFTNEINQDMLLTQLDIMKTMSIYDVLHIDAGWEGSYPLEIDTKKFPQGFKTLMDKAAEGKIRLGMWINPFSNSYEQYVSYAGMHRDHPEWHVPGMERRDPKKNYASGPFAINSDYYFYVRDKLLNLVKTYNIRAIYWDGADWNIPDASAPGLTEEQRNIARVQGLKRLMALMDDIHKIAPDIIVVPWNSTADVHLLGSVEQLQLSDVWELPLGDSELFRQQQFYASTYHLPYYSIWGDWYAISYKENNDNNLKQPIDLLKYVETRMVGIGGMVAGGSLDLTKTPPELINHLKKLYTWRKKFEDYFTVYQHVLAEPERGVIQVTGEAHIINGAGFILLDNSNPSPMEVNLPLSAPELELDSSKIYRLYDWSNLENAVPLGEARPGEGFPLTIPPRTVRIIGINLPAFNPATSSGQ
jgi:hypothetical protein